MIFGRTAELKYLNTYYERGGSQVIILYGRSGVGQTGVVNEFTQDKPCYYYKARSCAEREQRYQWGRELSETETIPEYPSFGEIFQRIFHSQNDKKIIVIDEFHYLVKGSTTFMQELISFTNGWEEPAMVILCSSALGWVENSMVNKIGKAAYGLSGLLKINELSFRDLEDYFSMFRLQECVEAYAILGGMPGLWQYFDDRLSIRDNICQNILKKGCCLYRQGERIAAEELRELGVYHTILASIAAGKYKLNDLYLHTGFSRAKISVYLKNLMELELVEKVFSYDTDDHENVQKGVYRISNHFVSFYFTYLYPHSSSLESMSEAEFYKKYINPTFKNYVADYFKKVCLQYMEQWNRRKRLPLLFERSGEWVGKVGTIDIVARDEAGKTLIGLCNWNRPMMRYDDYEWLLFCAGKARLRPDYIYLFSVGRFDEKLTLEAKVKHNNLKLISMDEL